MWKLKRNTDQRSVLHGDIFFIRFDFRDGCFLDGVKHFAKLKVFPFFVAGRENVRGHRAGAQPLPGGSGGCNVIANLRIMLHGVARRHIGGRWGVGSD